MNRGSDHDSISIPFPLKPAICSVQDIHPGIARDLSQRQASCDVNRMLEHFLEQVTVPGEKHHLASLFNDVRDAVVPIANKFRLLANDYCANQDSEIDRYRPFILLVNAILAETEKLAEKSGNLDKYKFRSPALGLLAHRNAAKPIYGYYDDTETEIIPDVLFTSLAAALRASEDIFTTWAEYSTSEAVLKAPHRNFIWPDALVSVEFKLQDHELPPPPKQYTSEGSPDIPAVADHMLETLPTSSAAVLAPRPNRPQTSKSPVTTPDTSTHRMTSRIQAIAELGFTPSPVYAVMERSPNAEPPKRPRKRGPPIVRTAMYAAERLGAGFASLHVINMLIADGVFWIWFYDREGCIQSSGIDFIQDLPRLIVLLFALQRFELRHWGFHPELDALARQIHRGFAGTDTQPDLSPEVLERIQVFVTEKGAKAGSNSTLNMDTLLTLNDGKSIKVDCKSRRPIHQRHGLCGRATEVFAISEIQTDHPPVGAERFVLKAYWPDVARLPEHEVVQSAYRVCPKDPDVVDHLPYVFGSRDDTEFATGRIRTALAVKSISRGRVLRLIAFEELYRLQDQPTEIGMHLILEAMKCHYTLWVNKIHHTDISLDNIMVRRRRTRDNHEPRLLGVVNDWDLASTPNSAHPLLERTGTIPYMHPELLTAAYWDGKVPRLYLHDNTSFIWVMAFLFLRYDNGKIINTPTLPLDDLITNNYEMARMIKNDIKTTIPLLICGPNAKKEWELVVDLLLWTSSDGRDDAMVRARNDPTKITQLLNTDNAPGVYKEFWDVVRRGATAVRLNYILGMVPKVDQPSPIVVCSDSRTLMDFMNTLLASPTRKLSGCGVTQTTSTVTVTWAQEIHSQAWRRGNDCTQITKGVLHLDKAVSGSTSLIIVRKEYTRIWSYIERASSDLMQASPFPRISRGLVVWGHPGIGEQHHWQGEFRPPINYVGKSLFLLYALVQALLAKRPVALCRSAHSFLYFDDTGVTLVNWPNGDALTLPPGVIALYDTVVGQDSPQGVFTDPLCGAYIVHATSPKVSRWKEWAKQLEADLWPMPLWSNDELRKIDIIYPRDTAKYYTAVQLAAFLGPSPRKCADLIEIGTPFDYTPLDFSDGSRLYNALTSGEVLELSQGLNFHLYFFAATIRDCGVRKHGSNPANYCRYYIPTRFLRQAALQTFQDMSIVEQQNLCHRFSAHPQLCGAFYEVLGVKCLMVDGLRCTFLRAGPNGEEEDVRNLPPGLKILESDDDGPVDPSNFNVDRLWIPPPNFPSVDAVAILNGGMLVRMLQLSIAQWHDIKASGIARVLIKFSVVTGVRFEFVFITSSEEIGRRMAITKGTLSRRQPSALHLPTSGHVAATRIEIPVGYAVAQFLKPDDLQALAVGAFIFRPPEFTARFLGLRDGQDLAQTGRINGRSAAANKAQLDNQARIGVFNTNAAAARRVADGDGLTTVMRNERSNRTSSLRKIIDTVQDPRCIENIPFQLVEYPDVDRIVYIHDIIENHALFALLEEHGQHIQTRMVAKSVADIFANPDNRRDLLTALPHDHHLLLPTLSQSLVYLPKSLEKEEALWVTLAVDVLLREQSQCPPLYEVRQAVHRNAWKEREGKAMLKWDTDRNIKLYVFYCDGGGHSVTSNLQESDEGTWYLHTCDHGRDSIREHQRASDKNSMPTGSTSIHGTRSCPHQHFHQVHNILDLPYHYARFLWLQRRLLPPKEKKEKVPAKEKEKKPKTKKQ
ncbi:hypothetical protein C8R44DRAFT_743248 [Mycena epipterygia]|nr:hypothetical protein C8R44DRAFT_743248 [Mycena epipterygia]